jgi:hypothetical protein
MQNLKAWPFKTYVKENQLFEDTFASSNSKLNMFTMKKFIVFVLGALIFTACGTTSETTNEENPNEALEKEVMAIHDEVMPKMGEINKLKNDILKRADSLAEAGEEEAAARLKALGEELEEAGSSMMVWMRQYKPGDLTEEEIKSYLEDQKVKVEEVKEKINGSLEKARKEMESWMEEE